MQPEATNDLILYLFNRQDWMVVFSYLESNLPSWRGFDEWAWICWSDSLDPVEPSSFYHPGVMRTDITAAYASQRSKCILSDLHTECRDPYRALSPCHTFLLFSKDQEPQAYVKHLVVLSQWVMFFLKSIATMAHIQLNYNVS